MKRLPVFLVIVLLLLAGCGENKQSDDGLITVDVTASYPKKELILQDFMDVEYILLETTDDFITTAHLQAISEDMMIMRNRNRSSDGDIFIFDRNGKGLRKINRLGQGGEEYTFLLGVALDEDNNEMYVNDHDLQKIFVYDLFGNFKRSFGHKKDVWYDKIYNFDKDHLICHDGTGGVNKERSNIFVLISKQDGRVTEEIQIPYKEKKSTMLYMTDEAKGIGYAAGVDNDELIPYNDGWMLVEPSSDTIYRLQPHKGMVPFIARTPSIQSMNPEVFLFPGVLTDRYYFMQAVKREYDFEKDTGFPATDLMYDREEKTLFEYIVYNADFSNKETVNLANGITLINNEIAFLHKLEAHQLVDAYEKGQLRGKLKEIAAGLDEESNPVIMLVKHKM